MLVIEDKTQKSTNEASRDDGYQLHIFFVNESVLDGCWIKDVATVGYQLRKLKHSNKAENFAPCMDVGSSL